MKRALSTISDGVLEVQRGWILVDIVRADSIRIRGYEYADTDTRIVIRGCGYADTDTRIRIRGYGYADMDTRIRKRRYEYADTTTRIRICEYGLRGCGYADTDTDTRIQMKIAWVSKHESTLRALYLQRGEGAAGLNIC